LATPEEIAEYLKKKRAAPATAEPAVITPPSAPMAPVAQAAKSAVGPVVSTEPLAPMEPAAVEQTVGASDAYFSALTGRKKEEALAKLKTDVALAPTFEDYSKMSRAISEIEDAFVPGEIVEFAGAKPKKSSASAPLGLSMLSTAPAAIPLNAPFVPKQTGMSALGQAFRPQTMIGPVTAGRQKDFESVPSARAAKLFDDTAFAASLKDKTPVEIAEARESLEAARAGMTKIIENNPEASDEDIIKQFKTEMEDLPAVLDGTSKRAPPIKSEPGKAPSVAAGIYGRQTTGATVPNLSGAQAAYLEKYYLTAQPRLSTEASASLRERLQTEEIATGGGLPSRGGTPTPIVYRKRTPEEVETAMRIELPKEIAKLQAPWWTTGKRDEIIRNPEKFATGGGFFETTYGTGATKEGFGAQALRYAMSPMNIASTLVVAGTTRAAEAAGRLAAGPVAGAAEVPSVMAASREKKGGLAASLPDNLIGDLAEAVAGNRSATQTVGDIYKELGMSEGVGTGLGFALDILAPPLLGIASSVTKGGGAVRAARASQAAGLIGSKTPLRAGLAAVGENMAEAWFWRSAQKGGAAVAGSIKIAAAEETGKLLAARQALRDLPEMTTPEEVAAFITRYADENDGGGKLIEEMSKMTPFVRLRFAKEVQNSTDTFFKGAKSVTKEADSITDALKARNLSDIPDDLVKTLITNAAARSDGLMNVLRSIPEDKLKDSGKVLQDLYNADPAAVNRAVGAVTSFDAFNKIQKAKGFAEFPDLVMMSKRFIGAPQAAVQVAAAAKKTFAAKLIAAVLEGKQIRSVAASPDAMKISPNRVQQVVDVSDDEAGRLLDAVIDFERAGLMSPTEAALTRAGLERREISIEGLRSIAEANIDETIIEMGKGIEAARVRPGTIAARGIVGKAAEAVMGVGPVSEKIIKARLFTPPEMRSIFDGVLEKVKYVINDAKFNRQALDLSPAAERAIQDFYAAASKLDGKIKSVFKALKEDNPRLRAAYGLPMSGPVSDTQAVDALIRGASEVDSVRFIDNVIDMTLSGYKDTAELASLWMTRTFHTTNTDTYLTAAGKGARDAAKAKAVTALRSGTPSSAVTEELLSDMKLMLADRANTTPAYRLSSQLPIDVKNLPKYIGGALYGRELEVLKKAAERQILSDDAINAVEGLLPFPIRGTLGTFTSLSLSDIVDAVPRPDALKGMSLLIAGAINARKAGNGGSEGLIRGVLKELYPALTEAESIRAAREFLAKSYSISTIFKQHSSVFYSAAEQAMRRAGLNDMGSIDDVIDVTLRAKGAEDAGSVLRTRSLLTGQVIDDALTKFVTEEGFKKVMTQVASELPRNLGAAQRIKEVVFNALQFIGNVRYNAFLYLRPNYHVNNVVGAPAILHATLGTENAPLVTDFYHAGRSMENGIGRVIGRSSNDRAFIDAAGRPFTYGDLREIGVNSGLFKTEQQVLFSKGSLEEIIKVAEGMNPKPPQKVMAALRDAATWPAEVGNSTDNFWRMASFIKAVREGKPLTVAQEIGKKSLYDFGSLGPAERAFASRFLIFYTFARVAAEQLAKTLGNPASLSRFLKQAQFTKNASEILYEASGGKDYDVTRFLMKDRDLSKIAFSPKYVGTNKYLQFTPTLLAGQDSFMTLAGILYAQNPLEVVAGGETGLFQFLDPFLKEAVANMPEDEQQRRADRLRLVDPRQIALLQTVGALPLFIDTVVGVDVTGGMGKLTAIEPSRDTTVTYAGSEWQLDAASYGRYKELKRWAAVAGLQSTANYYGQVFTDLRLPTRQNLEAATGFGAKAVVTPEQQELAVLERQVEDIGAIRRAREEQAQVKTVKEIRGGQ
jgi:hypothetical protein